MANRYPIIIDTADGNKLKELPENDSLYLSGNTISGVGNITSTATISGLNVTATGTITAPTLNVTTGNISNIITSSLTINSVNIGPTLAAKANSADLGSVAFTNSYNSLINPPSIPTDVVDLTDVTGVLTLNAAEIEDVLGYTPYDAVTNTAGFLISALDIGDALGYTPYDAVTNAAGFLTSISALNIGDALGYTPYDAVTNAAGFITSESDTLDSVTDNGATTTNVITTGGFTTTGTTSTGALSVSGAEVAFSRIGTVTIDGLSSTTIAIGGTANLSLRDLSGTIDVQASLVPNTDGSSNLGAASFRYSTVYANTLNIYQLSTVESSSWTIGGNLEIQPGSVTGVVRVTRGGFGIPSTTTTNRDNLSVAQAGYMIYNSTINRYQGYAATGSVGAAEGWIDLWMGPPGAQPSTAYEGKFALADGTLWNPAGDGSVRLMCYLRGAWRTIS